MSPQARFSENARHYEGASPIQASSGERLLSLLSQSGAKLDRVLDLGCGTGRMLRECVGRYHTKACFGIDSAPEMIAIASKQIPKGRFSVADIDSPWEELVGPRGVSTVYSNFALQWLEDAFRKVQLRFLQSEAEFLGIAVPVSGSFEWLEDHIESVLGERISLWPFPSVAEVLEGMQGLSLVAIETERLFSHYHTLREALKAIQSSGAVSSRPRLSYTETRKLLESESPMGATLDFLVSFLVFQAPR